MTIVKERPQTRRVTEEDLISLAEFFGEKGGVLMEGRNLKCPGCEQVSDILDYVPLEHSEKYAAEVVVPLKCRACRHVFALRP